MLDFCGPGWEASLTGTHYPETASPLHLVPDLLQLRPDSRELISLDLDDVLVQRATGTAACFEARQQRGKIVPGRGEAFDDGRQFAASQTKS